MRHEKLADGVSVFLGDCREIIPTLSNIDSCVTDPPYGIQTLVGGYDRGGKRLIANDTNLDMIQQVFPLLRKKVKCGWILLFYSPRNTPEFFEAVGKEDYFGEIVWDKLAPGLGFGKLRYQHENIAIYKRGEPDHPDDSFMSVIRTHTIAEVHPHEKPVTLLRQLIKYSTPWKGTVLDPFCGSGTTGMAAVSLNRKFIGIEIEPKYFDMSCKRIDKALRAPSLLVKKPKPTQTRSLLS